MEHVSCLSKIKIRLSTLQNCYHHHHNMNADPIEHYLQLLCLVFFCPLNPINPIFVISGMAKQGVPIQACPVWPAASYSVRMITWLYRVFTVTSDKCLDSLVQTPIISSPSPLSSHSILITLSKCQSHIWWSLAPHLWRAGPLHST